MKRIALTITLLTGTAYAAGPPAPYFPKPHVVYDVGSGAMDVTMQPTSYGAMLVSPAGTGADWTPMSGTAAASVQPNNYVGLLVCTANCASPYGQTWGPWTGTGGGGGGATFPATPGVVYSTSTTASRNATASDIATLLGDATYKGPQVFQMGPMTNISGFEPQGDSITQCSTGYLTDLDNCYTATVSADLGGSFLVRAVAGWQSEDIAYNGAFAAVTASGSYPYSAIPNPANNPIRTYFALHNDLHYCGTTAGTGGSNPNGNSPGCRENALSAELATFTRDTISNATSSLAQNATTTTGTWVNDTALAGGSISTTNGSSKTLTLTTAVANQPVYLWYRGVDSDGGTASLSIDSGAQTDTLSTASTNGQCFCTINGNHNTVQGKRYIIPTAGSHTFTYTVTSATSASNTVDIVGVGTPAQNANAYTSPPALWVFSPIPEYLFANLDATNAYTSDEQALVAQLKSDGLLIDFTNSQPYMNNATMMSGSDVTVPNGLGDNYSGTTCTKVPSGVVGQHPNICGHNAIAQMFLAKIQPSPRNAYPGIPTKLFDLVSTTPPQNSARAINGGINYYKAGTPGNEAGTAFMVRSGFQITNYMPSNWGGWSFCTYTSGASISDYNQFTSCGLKISPLGVITTAQFISGGSAPTIAAAGTTTGLTISGTNMAGTITLVTGGTPAVGALGTITFNGTLTTAPRNCTIEPRDAATSALSHYASAPTTTTWTFGVLVAPTVATTYTWGYNCGG